MKKLSIELNVYVKDKKEALRKIKDLVPVLKGWLKNETATNE